MHAFGRGLLASIAVFTLAPVATAQDTMPTPEQMWEIIQQQQAVIEDLRGQVERNNARIGETRDALAETDTKVEATGDLIEQTMMEDEGAGGGWWANTQLGGYGEVHYEARGKNYDRVDVHRLVLFLGHDFTDDLRFGGELEVEHALAGDGKPGEVEVEQAFIEWDYTANSAARAGVFLIPVGFLNETHEPPTYYGVERNNVEAQIIPTTWWEAGVGVAGQVGTGWSYDLSAHSGLKLRETNEDDYKIRGGRQKVAYANANNGAFTGRVKYTGMPGIELGFTGQYQTDVTQNGEAEAVPATLFEGHIGVQRGIFGLRALAAQWTLDGDRPEALGRDRQWGYFLEPSLRFDAGGGREIGLFTRYSMWDNNAGNSADTGTEQYDIGANFWLHEDVVLKLDYAFKEPESGGGTRNFNAGVGFQF